MVESSIAPADGRGLSDAERVEPRMHVLGAAITGLVAIAWVGLSARSPTLTYHFAPLIGAAAWPAALRGGRPVRVSPLDARRAAIGAAALTYLATAVLLVFDWLRGPTFWDSGPAIVEVVPMVLVGAVGGYRYARCGVPGSPAD